MSKTSPNKNGKRLLIGLLLIAAIAFGGWKFFGAKEEQNEGATFVVRRSKLPIKVITGGSLEALESQEVRSEVKGYEGTKILSIVEEGYLVTEEDVKNGKVLVELDSSALKQKIVQQDISLQSTISSLTEAQQTYDIQLTQNKTDVKAADQKVRFAMMDLEKFMGSHVTREIISQLPVEVYTNSTATPVSTPEPTPVLQQTENKPEAGTFPGGESAKHVLLVDASSKKPNVISANAPANTLLVAPKAPAPPAARAAVPASIDFTKYAKVELLGDGEAKQKLRKFEDDVLVAKSEHGLAKTQFDGTQRLAAKGFVTKNNLANEQINIQKSDLKVQTAETARDLFIKYEFPKLGEELLSKYEEAIRLHDRASKEAISKLAQANARLRSAESRYKIEQQNQKELNEQVDYCTIKAKKPGLVVYGGGDDGMYYGQEPIREGATIRERQPIITIPDTSQMSVKVRIHESHIEKIKKGLKTQVRVDAFPERVLEGEVIKVGVLPDSQNRWLNPDLKLYLCNIKIIGNHDWVKPGMSAKVEVHVKELPDVVHVPIQAVTPENGEHFAYVLAGGDPERRKVKIGEFNDEFIEIKEGLKEDEKVLLRAPNSGPDDEKRDAKPEEKKDAPPAAAQAAKV